MSNAQEAPKQPTYGNTIAIARGVVPRIGWRNIPGDSRLRSWLDARALTEVPFNYQVVTGLSVLGTLMSRNVCHKGNDFKIWPNMSVLLVGPSGIGKDTIIDLATASLREVDADLILQGRTIEIIKALLVERGDPAVAFIPAGELTAMLGGKDYQKGMVPELTDILSTKDVLDFSSRTDGQQFIFQPTVTMMGGSTAAWLAKAMPDGSLEGGFIPRFLVMVAEHSRKVESWSAFEHPLREIQATKTAERDWQQFLSQAYQRARKLKQVNMPPTEDGMDLFRAWDWTRHMQFAPGAVDYAHRARGHVHKLAMLMAITRGKNYVDHPDYRFALDVMGEVRVGIEEVLLPIVRRGGR